MIQQIKSRPVSRDYQITNTNLNNNNNGGKSTQNIITSLRQEDLNSKIEDSDRAPPISSINYHDHQNNHRKYVSHHEILPHKSLIPQDQRLNTEEHCVTGPINQLFPKRTADEAGTVNRGIFASAHRLESQGIHSNQKSQLSSKIKLTQINEAPKQLEGINETENSQNNYEDDYSLQNRYKDHDIVIDRKKMFGELIEESKKQQIDSSGSEMVSINLSKEEHTPPQNQVESHSISQMERPLAKSKSEQIEVLQDDNEEQTQRKLIEIDQFNNNADGDNSISAVRLLSPTQDQKEDNNQAQEIQKPIENIAGNGNKLSSWHSSMSSLKFGEKKSFFLFLPTNPVRIISGIIVTSKYFEFFILTCIVANCIALAFYDYDFLSPKKSPQTTGHRLLETENQTSSQGSSRMIIIDKINIAFTAVFVFEGLLKSIFKGFIIHKKSFIRGQRVWSVIDLIVIVSGIIEIFINASGSNALRIIRVIFRPLKTVNVKATGMKNMLKSLVESVSDFANVVVFLVFVFILFATMGLQQYEGAFSSTCRITDEPVLVNQTINGISKEIFIWESDLSYKRACSSNGQGNFICPGNQTCGNIELYPELSYENEHLEDRFYLQFGIINFDNLGNAFLTVFQMITCETFYQQAVNMMDVDFPFIGFLYTFFIIIVGNFFLMNLVLAVIFQAFQKSHQKKIEDELKQLEGEGEDSLTSEIDQELEEELSEEQQDEDEQDNDEYGEEEIEEALEQVDDPQQTICNNDASQSIAPGVSNDEPRYPQSNFLRSKSQNVDKLRTKKKSTSRTLVKKNTTANVSQNQSTNLRKIKSVKCADAQSTVMQSQFAKTIGGGFIDFDDQKLMEEQRKYDNNEDFTAFLRVHATKRKIANMFIEELKEGVNHPIKHAISSKSHNLLAPQGDTNQTLQKVDTEELKIVDCEHTNSVFGPSFQGALQPVKSTMSLFSKKKPNSPRKRRQSQMIQSGEDTLANQQLLKLGQQPHDEGDETAQFQSQQMIMPSSGINCEKILDPLNPNPENHIEASHQNGKLTVPHKKHHKVLKQKTAAAHKSTRFKLIDSSDNQAIKAALGESPQQKQDSNNSQNLRSHTIVFRRKNFNKKASKTFTQNSGRKIITSSDSYDSDSDEDRNMNHKDSLAKGQPGEEEQGMQGLLMKKFNIEIMKKMADIQEQTEVHKNEVKDRIDNNMKLKIMFRIIQSKVFNAFYLLVLISNIIVLSIDHSNVSNIFTTQLEAETFNIVFVSLYALELILKFGLFGVKSYFVTSQYVIFDCLVVIVGLVDIIVSSVLLSEEQLFSSAEITILRGLRILRIFKLIKYWRSFEILVETLWMTILSIQHFVQILLILLVIYTLLGLELFSNKAKFDHKTERVDFEHGSSPVFNFDNFLNSFTTVFVILTNDKQSEIYYNFFRAVSGISSTIFWMTFIILAQKILLNLFLSILLQNFNEGTLKNKILDEEKEFIQDPLAHEAEKYNKWINIMKERIIFFLVKAKSLFRRIFQRRSRRRQESDQGPSNSKVVLEEQVTNKEQPSQEQEAISKHSFEAQRQLEKQRKKVIIGKSLGFIPPTFKARKFVHRILKNNNFSRFIVVCILASAIQLALDSPILDPDSQYKLTLFWIDLTTIIVFTIEGIAKIFAYGLVFNGP